MRRRRERSATLEPLAERPQVLAREPARGPLRRVQWSSYYHRFFGRVRAGDRVPDSLRPLSLDDSTKTLHDVYVAPAPVVPRSERHRVARRCVSQMLLYGYRPADERRAEFEAVVQSAASPETPAGEDAGIRAREFLLRWGAREFSPTEPPSKQQRNRELADAAPEVQMISRPTVLMHDRGSFVVTKQVYLRTKVDRVSHLINPENWERLGEFFARTVRENPQDRAEVPGRDPWRGVLQEDFIVSWNGFTTNVFRQRLKVDYTVVDGAMARADYALMYEEDDQIVANEGYLLVEREPGLPAGWISGRMKKRLKFTSSMLNLLCPALLPMLLDSNAGGFNNFLDEIGPAA